MTSCEKQANKRRLGWISTGALVLFAFLITLPFAGQSNASTAHSHAGMETNFVSPDSLGHQGMSTKLAMPDTHARRLCEVSGHVEHKTHICCFQSTDAVRAILQRDLSLLEKPVFADSSASSFALESDRAPNIMAVEASYSGVFASQRDGLDGAQAEFLHTQRLLT